MRPDPPSFLLDGAPDAVRGARQFVADQLSGTDGAEFADDAALVASELLANALQHGAPPVIIRVAAEEGRVRVEVQDGSRRAPVRTKLSADNMTGRGIALVEQLSVAWGVRIEPGDGKTVWCELAARGDGIDDGALDIDALLEAWDDTQGTGEERYTVVLGDVPTTLLLDAKAHIDNLVREFSLMATGSA